MKRNRLLTIAVLNVAALAVASAGQSARGTSPAGNAGALTVPAGATSNGDGSFSWTDKNGKTWIYTSNPWGVTRVAAQVSAAAPKGVPRGAVRNGDGTYSYTAKDGSKWTYVATPFGISRKAATVPQFSEVSPANIPPGTKVVDRGESVRFESPTPFGISVREKKKTDLTVEEQQFIEDQEESQRQQK